MIEIERKFLVTGNDWKEYHPVHCIQGYLSLNKHRTVRVRIAGESAWITVKGLTVGASRQEFEYEIPIEDAKEMILMCSENIVEKNRYTMFHDGDRWEVDEFLGHNKGLVVAEIELRSEEDQFSKPDWIGKEVTDDPSYYNSCLSQNRLL